MRIRKRPPLLPSSPSPSQNADPSLRFQLPNGREREESWKQRGRGLHSAGDLSVDSQYGWSTDPSPSNPYPKLPHSPVLKEEKEVELDSSSSQKTWDAQVNSNKSSGAQVSSVVGAEIRQWSEGESAVMPPKKSGGWVEIGNGVERKTKVRARAKLANNTTTTLNTSTSTSCNYDRIVREEGHGSGNGKKRRSPAVLIEGSRCSRVNGRGWRCCQQTLVGYSLCEHHLGKGRLRSMSSVRGGQVMTNTNRKPKKNYFEDGENGGSTVVLSLPQVEQEKKHSPQQDFLGADDNGEKKGRKKMGIVKARSISSLLDETDQPSIAAMIQSSSPVLPQDSNNAMV